MDQGTRNPHERRWPFACAITAALLTFAMCVLLSALRKDVASGGDNVAYLLAARYNPLSDNFDNPAHGWGYPALIKMFRPVFGSEDSSSLFISAASMGFSVFVGSLVFFRHLPAYSASIATLVLSCHGTVIWSGTIAMSDALFAALGSAVVWIICLRESSPGMISFAGAASMYSLFVRGNGIALLASSLASLALFGKSRTYRSVAFLSGAAACLSVAMISFLILGVPLRHMFRSGAGELAFAILDKSDTWLHRLDYELSYPTYGSLIAKHGWTMIRSAAKTVYHLHDWWLLPVFGVLGMFVTPGLLVALRRAKTVDLQLGFIYVAVQATYLWSGRFMDGRHLLFDFPFILLLAFLGLGFLPRRRILGVATWSVLPIRSVAIASVALASIIPSLATYTRILGRTSAVERDMHLAGVWLRQNAAKGDRIAATRLNITYYAGLRPLGFVDVFGTRPPPLSDVARVLRSSSSRWIAWIKGHSDNEFPDLLGMELGSDAPGLKVRFSNPNVVIYEVTP